MTGLSTLSFDTTAVDHPSTPRCAAPCLEGQQREALALQGVAGTQPISTRSARHGVSRTFLYPPRPKAAEAQPPRL